MQRLFNPVWLLVVLLLLTTTLGGCLNVFSSNDAPNAEFSLTPSGTVKVGDEISADASASSDPDGDSLTFRWDWGDDKTSVGKNSKHTYTIAGSYTVILRVSDADFESVAKKELEVLSANATSPTADIAVSKANSCAGEAAATGTYILYWICKEKDSTDRSMPETTTVVLDAAASSAGDATAYITAWTWDLNVNVDSDDDGESDNDEDASGETYEWKDRPPGEWEVKLTVSVSNGLTATAKMMVYVNYRARWVDFEIDRNSSNAATIDFEWPVSYDRDTKNTMRKAVMMLTYPKEDDDFVSCPGNICANRLDIYGYNETERSSGDDVKNTSAIGDDARNYGDCNEDENYCVHLTFTGYNFGQREEGSWMTEIRNEKTHNTDISEFMIVLTYK